MRKTGLRHFDVSDAHRTSGHRRFEADFHKHQLGKVRNPFNPEQNRTGIDPSRTDERSERNCGIYLVRQTRIAGKVYHIFAGQKALFADENVVCLLYRAQECDAGEDCMAGR